MPYPNEHTARLRDPEEFTSDGFRRENDAFGRGIHAIYGRLKSDPEGAMVLQAIHFDAEIFTEAEAREWLERHGYRPILFEPAEENNGEKSVGNVHYRSGLGLRYHIEDDGDMRAVARISSDAPCHRGGNVYETLSHADDAVEVRGRSLLLGHDPAAVIGSISFPRFVSADGRRYLEAELRLAREAKLPTGISVADAVQRGYLSGVSIGYSYLAQDVERRENGNNVELLVKRWQLREVSLTPVPADVSASVISVASREEGTKMPSDRKEDALAREARIYRLAAEAGVKPDGLPLDDEARAREEIARRVALNIAPPPASSVVVTKDVREKVDQEIVEALCARALPGQFKAKGDLARASVSTMVRAYARSRGENLDRASDLEVAKYALLSRAYPIGSSGEFATYLLAETANKVVAAGFNAVTDVTYTAWTSPRKVKDFKPFKAAGLDVGNLVKVPEGTAFPELSRGEGGCSGKLSMWGGVLSLTLEAFISDELGEFLRVLGLAGALAKKTIESQVYSALASASWSSRTLAGSALSESTLDAVRAAMLDSTGPAGTKLGIPPRYLLVPAGLGATAKKLTLGVYAGVAATPASVLPHADILPVITPYLDTAATPANSTWYVAGDPSVVDTVIVATLEGVDEPQVVEIDPGRVAARMWRIAYPFAVVVPAEAYRLGLYRATA